MNDPHSANRYDHFPRTIELALQGLIIYSIITLCVETVPEFSHYENFFFWSEVFVVTVFTGEYVWRLALSRPALAYPRSFLGVVDLLAILPFYLGLGADLRIVRAVRLLRIFRILKLGRYSRSLQLLGRAICDVGPELAVLGFVACIVLLISAMSLYYAERDLQPDAYRSIPHSLWWAIVTLTTVGYGDVCPQSAIGKLVASVVMILGIGLIAIPTGLISSALTEIIHKERLEVIESGSVRADERPDSTG